MFPDGHHEVDFLQWLDALPDDEVLIVLEMLRGVATDLAIPIDRQALAPQDLFNLPTHSRVKISLN